MTDRVAQLLRPTADDPQVTVGVSPKVVWPVLALLAAGVVLVLAGHADLGTTLVVAAVGTGVIGRQAPAAPTVPRDPDQLQPGGPDPAEGPDES